MITQAVIVSQSVNNALVQSTDSVSVINVPDGYSFCGPAHHSIIDDSTNAVIADTLVSYSPTTKSLTINPTTKSQIGVHSYSLKLDLPGYPSATLTLPAIVKVTVTSGCETTVITWS